MQETPKYSAALVLAAGFLVLFIGGGARFAMGLTLKPMADEFGWGRGELGGAVLIFQFVSADCMFLAGRAADRVGPRAILCGGVALAGLSIALMSLASRPWHVFILFGVFFAMGNGLASISPVSVMVTRAFPRRAGMANSVVASGMSAGQLAIIAALAVVLVSTGWRAVYVWVGVAHILLLPLLFWTVPSGAETIRDAPGPTRMGLSIAEAARTRQFWLLIGVYAICGFGDFFVSTHVVAFAQDKGVDMLLAGNLLAVMGLTGFLGVLLAGYWGDRSGPIPATAASFAARVAVFGLIIVDQSPLSVAIFALVFGITFLVTAPLAVLFVRDAFGDKHLGAISGLIIMIHHICGGLGAYIGAAIFDRTGHYDLAFAIMLTASFGALMLTLGLRRHPALA